MIPRPADRAQLGSSPLMNYRHAYHAGNFADVVKHAVLALMLAHLAKKEAGWRFIDTHAGVGAYDLSATRRRAPASGATASAASRRISI